MSTENHSFRLAPSSIMGPEKSAWQSPMTYLFGGLAAMLGLIAFALLILAFSYWRLTSEQNQQDSNDNDEGDLEKGDGINKRKFPVIYEEKIVVIMAGDHVPTFLANPVQKTFVNQDFDKLSNLGAHDESVSTSTSTDTAEVEDKSFKEDEDDQHNSSLIKLVISS